MLSSEKNKIIWIASYPKSGNTWIRSIISSMFLAKKGKFNFSLLDNIKVFDIPSRYEFVKHVNKIDYKKLNDLNILSKYWLDSQKKIYKKNNHTFFKNISFFKTHSANINLDNKQFTNTDNSAGLIYIVRDPRDIVISYAKHYDKSIDTAINNMLNDMHILKTTEKKYPILISKPNLHYKSWQYLKVPKIIVKYEDLLANPHKIINEIMLFFQIFFNYNFDKHKEILENIVKTTKFKRMQNFEKKNGFNEAPYASQNKNFKELFFRKGSSKQWVNILTPNQIKKIESHCNDLMKKFDYL